MDMANTINQYGMDKANTKMSQLDKSSKHKIKTAQMLFSNLKECIKNLLQGVLKMHQYRIVNRDIKEENIMANYNEETKKVDLRFIDYGLSENLTPEYCTHYSNIIMQGTYILIAPEIFIIYNINKYSNYNDEYIMNKINTDINSYVKKMHQDLKLDTSDMNNKINKIYFEIKNLFNNHKILEKYFGVNDNLNGYLQKNDVYSLGITLYEFLNVYTTLIDVKKDLRLNDLLKNMITLNPNERFNALQCLQHPYFK
jgi:serine/threonine protein kinase